MAVATSLEDTGSLSRILLYSFDSQSFELSLVSEKDFSQNEKYGFGESNFFESIHIDLYKDAKPLIVAYQQSGPRGVFAGIFTGERIEEINYYPNYHSYNCFGAKFQNESYHSFGAKDSMRVLSLVNANF